MTLSLDYQVIDYVYRAWYRNGLLHRDDDLPAWIWYNPAPVGYYWFKHGKVHRDGDLPAAVYSNGGTCYYQHGERHRGNGLPANVPGPGATWSTQWWLFGRHCSQKWVLLILAKITRVRNRSKRRRLFNLVLVKEKRLPVDLWKHKILAFAP